MGQDDEALERFCIDAHPRLVAALTHQFGDPWLAEELAQDALIRACDRWATVSDMESPIGWTFRVGVNLGNSIFRRRSAERRARARRGADRTVHHDPDTADRLAVSQALDELTVPQREAIVLRYFLGLTAGEAAAILSSTAGAVRALTHRAISTLRDALDEPLLAEEAPHVP